jgi:hypothetical protein
MGELTVFKFDLAFQFSARIRLFRKDIDSLEIGAKAHMLALLVYVGKASG